MVVVRTGNQVHHQFWQQVCLKERTMAVGLGPEVPPQDPEMATSHHLGFYTPAPRPRSQAMLASATGQLNGRGHFAIGNSPPPDTRAVRYIPRGSPNPHNNASVGVLSSLGGRSWAQSGGMSSTSGFVSGLKPREPQRHFLEDIHSMKGEAELAGQQLEMDWAARTVPSIGNFSTKRGDFDPYQRPGDTYGR